MSIIRFVDRGITEPTEYEISLMTGILKYALKKNLPSGVGRNTFIYTTDTHELYHGAGVATPLRSVYTDEEAKRTVVFYIGMINKEKQTMSIFVPFKGDARKLYINLGNESDRDLNVIVRKPKDETDESELTSAVVKKGEQHLSMEIEGLVESEPLEVVVDGELSLADISILVDIIPHRN